MRVKSARQLENGWENPNRKKEDELKVKSSIGAACLTAEASQRDHCIKMRYAGCNMMSFCQLLEVFPHNFIQIKLLRMDSC